MRRFLLLIVPVWLAAGCGGANGAQPTDDPGAGPAPPSDVPSMSDQDGGAPPSDTPLPPCKRTVPVSTHAELAASVGAAKPGDCIVVADGQYAGVSIDAKGTADAPIVVKAAHRLKASFTSGIVLSGARSVILEGFSFGGTAPAVKIESSKACRLTRSKVTPASGTWISVTGNSDRTRIDHCDIGGASSSQDILHPSGLTTNTSIDHNYFHDLRAPHTVTLGCCGPTADYHDTGDIAEHNLFVNCRSGAELFSIKSSGSTVRYNTVRACQGDIDIRAGRHNSIYGNYIFNGTIESGIRMYEDDHDIYDNYVESARALQVGPGHEAHAQVKNATIVFNTFVGPVHFGDDSNTTFSNNIVLGKFTISPGANGSAPTTPTYQSNILFMGNGAPATGFAVEDPRLVRMGDVLRPGPTSPAIGAAAGTFAFVADDIDGRPRAAKATIGAEEHSTAAATRRPLTEADVGPDAP
jgi:hypothetical protein